MSIRIFHHKKELPQLRRQFFHYEEERNWYVSAEYGHISRLHSTLLLTMPNNYYE